MQGERILKLGVDPSGDPDTILKVHDLLRSNADGSLFRLVIATDHTVDQDDDFMVAWQVLGNSDPVRDHFIISGNSLMIDGTIKFYRKGGFPRRWPNVVCSNPETINRINKIWDSLGFDNEVQSPSLKTMKLLRNGQDAIATV